MRNIILSRGRSFTCLSEKPKANISWIYILPMLSILAIALGCYCAPSPKGQLSPQTVWERDSTVLTERLDSLCIHFIGDSLNHKYRATDPRISFAHCAGISWENNPFSADFSLQLEAPCTVSVVLTDSTGHTVAFRHSIMREAGPFSVGDVDYLFKEFIGNYRYNVLIDGQLVFSCRIRITDRWQKPPWNKFYHE